MKFPSSEEIVVAHDMYKHIRNIHLAIEANYRYPPNRQTITTQKEFMLGLMEEEYPMGSCFPRLSIQNLAIWSLESRSFLAHLLYRILHQRLHPLL